MSGSDYFESKDSKLFNQYIYLCLEMLKIILLYSCRMITVFLLNWIQIGKSLSVTRKTVQRTEVIRQTEKYIKAQYQQIYIQIKM